MHNVKIGFIGSGNMACSLIGGLINSGTPADLIWASDVSDEQLQQVATRFGIHTTTDNQSLASEVDVVVLAVKPQLLKGVCEQLSDTFCQHRPLLVSVAAGILSDDILKWASKGNCELALVRTMPNTPALVQSGAAALYATPAVSQQQKTHAESIMRAVGVALWVEDEALIDAVTALSGSGPAYFFLMIEAMEKAGHELGLSSDIAHLLATQTAFGAAKMALESDLDAAKLRQNVTSPGGTTEQAIKVMQENDYASIMQRAMTAARDRARELSEQLGKQ